MRTVINQMGPAISEDAHKPNGPPYLVTIVGSVNEPHTVRTVINQMAPLS